MGLKYIEQIKSVVLFVLVLLSITLTFSIWTYKPNYDTLEKTKAVNSFVEKKRQLVDIIKPYRMIFYENGKWRGTDRFAQMEGILKEMQKWQISSPIQVSSNFNNARLSQLIEENNSFTLFFPGEIPYSIFKSLIPLNEHKETNMSFNQIIVGWNQLSNTDELTVFFANTNKKQLYKAKIQMNNKAIFTKQVLNPSHSLRTYAAFTRDKGNTLYLPEKESKMTQYTYLISTSSIDRFKNALFSNPKIVKNSIDDADTEETYTDGVSMMTVNNNKKVLDFVNTTAPDNLEVLDKAKLILSTFAFINEHGGWTGDFRYDSLDYLNNKVIYQLYIKDYPVYSDSLVTSTQIETVWGDNRIARYIRPYYKLVSVPENNAVTVMSGQDAINHLMNSKKVDFNNVEEIRLGYYLTKNDHSNILILKPTWFYRVNNNWTALSPISIGGGLVGLE